MEMAFLAINLDMLIIVIGFEVSMIWRRKSKKSIESQITGLSLAVLLVIGAVAQLVFATILGENIILAILQIIIWSVIVILYSIELKNSIKKIKKQQVNK